jgi:hypothetical protein
MDHRSNFHTIHHYQDSEDAQHAHAAGGHSYSSDGVRWVCSDTVAYTKNITWSSPYRDEAWTVFKRRERPGLLLDQTWRRPLALFSTVTDEKGESWMHAHPISSTPSTGGGAPCTTDADCNLNGVCGSSFKCACDPQWEGSTCGELALAPSDPEGGYHRPGFNGWGGNPFFSTVDNKFHVFTVEMTNGCTVLSAFGWKNVCNQSPASSWLETSIHATEYM